MCDSTPILRPGHDNEIDKIEKDCHAFVSQCYLCHLHTFAGGVGG